MHAEAILIAMIISMGMEEQSISKFYLNTATVCSDSSWAYIKTQISNFLEP